MKHLILNGTSEVIEAVLDGAPATSQPHFFSTYADWDGNLFSPDSEQGILSGTTDQVIVSSPASGDQRKVTDLGIYNADTADIVVTIKWSDGVDDRILGKATVAPGGTVTLDDLRSEVLGAEWGKIIGTLSDQSDLASRALEINSSGQLQTIDGTDKRLACRVTDASSQSIANNTQTAINFDTEEYDYGGFHDNSTNNTRFTMPEGGVYGFGAKVRFGSDTTGIREVAVIKNGGPNFLVVDRRDAGANLVRIPIAAEAEFSVDDYIELVVRQTSGGSLSVLEQVFWVSKVR